MSLGENIKKYRLKKKLTQEQLANLLYVSSQAVSKWECNENFPDGSLLVPLANALGISLDILFENKNICFNDAVRSVSTYLRNDKSENKFELVRSICWHLQEALFGIHDEDSFGIREDDNDIIYKCGVGTNNNSYILKENGFTQISNGRSPYFAVFPEPKDGWAQTIEDGENVRKIFECFADIDTMKAVLFVQKAGVEYVFDKEHLCQKCEIDNSSIDKVISNLMYLRLISEIKTSIDNEEHILYTTAPSHKVISLFLMAHEFYYKGGYSTQIHCRKTPFLK